MNTSSMLEGLITHSFVHAHLFTSMMNFGRNLRLTRPTSTHFMSSRPMPTLSITVV